MFQQSVIVCITNNFCELYELYNSDELYGFSLLEFRQFMSNSNFTYQTDDAASALLIALKVNRKRVRLKPEHTTQPHTTAHRSIQEHNRIQSNTATHNRTLGKTTRAYTTQHKRTQHNTSAHNPTQTHTT